LYPQLNSLTILPTPIEKIFLDRRTFYIKRDDLIDPYLSGNKYRKLYTLIKTPKERFTKIVSYGGTQSNAMLAVAALCRQKGWIFEYYTKPLHHNGEDRSSNYYHACKLGMIHKEIDVEIYYDFIASIALNFDESVFVLHQGGADGSAKEGVQELANEIRSSQLSIKSLATPSGTGTTALYLAECLPEYQIYTSPAIGTKEYLVEQMSALSTLPDNLKILDSNKKYHFAKPYKEFYDIYNRLKYNGVEFDLIYAPKLWKLLLEQTEEEILYIHSGGVTGNMSMLQRYRYKNLI
jgi:1-aminocyclopropane-1-carboxylate deaminase